MGKVEAYTWNPETNFVLDEVQVDALGKVEKLKKRLDNFQISVLGMDFDGTLSIPSIGFRVPFTEIGALKQGGLVTVLETGSSPITLVRKLISDGAAEAGISVWSDLFAAVECADGAISLKPWTKIDEFSVGSVAREKALPEDQLQIARELLLEWLECNQTLIKFVAFHPLISSIAPTEVYGYRLWTCDGQERDKLAVAYQSQAVVFERLEDWGKQLRGGTVKIVMRFNQSSEMRQLQEQGKLPGQLSGVYWQPGGQASLLWVADGLNKFQNLVNFVGEKMSPECWDKMAFIGNDVNDYAVMMRSRVAFIVESDAKATADLRWRLKAKKYPGLVVLIKPGLVGAVLNGLLER